MSDDKSYWNSFYTGADQSLELDLPTQFAAFAANELDRNTGIIIEFGAGNGRDSFFFAQHGFNVLALDSSIKAVESNKSKNTFDNLEFRFFEVGNSSFSELPALNLSKAIYARFFIHALSNNQIEIFFDGAQKMLGRGDRMFLEFRTSEDESRNKEFTNHFRNYVRIKDFESVAHKFDFSIEYTVSGVGYAKYKNDDAHVVRYMMKRK